MKDPFKFQYKSPNLARLQDIFVDSAREGFKTNYTITNKTIRSPKTPKSVSRHYEFKDIDFISDKCSQYQTPAFIKKYNKVLNEFCIPEGNKFITVDLDEKLKLHYLQSQIDLQKLGGKITSQSKLNDIKVNYILGSPNKSSKTEIDYGINTSPRANNFTPKSTNDFVQGINSIFCSSVEKKKSILYSTFNYIGAKKDEANEYSKSFLNLNRGSPKMSKINHNKKEIYLALYDNEKKVKPMVERIYQLKIAKSQEKDLRKKVILTSIIFNLGKIPFEIQTRLKKDFPDYIKGDYPTPKNQFPSNKMNTVKHKIDKIFTKDYSTLRISNFPVEKSNRIELNDLNLLNQN